MHLPGWNACGHDRLIDVIRRLLVCSSCGERKAHCWPEPYPIGLQYYLDSIAAVSDGRGYEEMKRSLPWAEEHLQVRMEWLPTCDPFAVAESHRSFHEEDMHADLPGILARTLLLHAEHGGTVSDADAAEIAAAIPACTALRVDGAGHMIPWDRLDFFVRAVREFLTE